MNHQMPSQGLGPAEAILWIGFGYPQRRKKRCVKNPDGVMLHDLCWDLNNCWYAGLFISRPSDDLVFNSRHLNKWALKQEELARLYAPVLADCRLLAALEIGDGENSLIVLKPWKALKSAFPSA